MATKKTSTSKVSVNAVNAAKTVAGVAAKINYNVIMVLLLIGGAFFIGRLTAQVEYLKNGVPSAAAQVPSAGAPAAQGTTASVIDIPGLKAIAKSVNLDEKKFADCLDNSKNQKKVADEQSYGSSVGVSGTPTFFINGIGLVGAQPLSKFEEVINAELKDGSGDKVTGVEPGGRKQITKGDHLRGNGNAKIRLVEFSDFECPFCHQAYPTVQSLLKEYGDKISLEYRQFPLTNIHPHAQKAAEASECASDQGKFWEMHDALFKAQGAQG